MGWRVWREIWILDSAGVCLGVWIQEGEERQKGKTVIRRWCQLVGVNHFFVNVILEWLGFGLVGLLRLFGDSRWTEYVRCSDSRAMERCVVSEWLANLEMHMHRKIVTDMTRWHKTG